MAHPQVLLHIVLCGNSPTYEYWIHSLKMKWYDTSVKEECLTGGASTTPTPIMTSDPVTHCLSLQLKSYSLLSDLLNKVTHCLSTSHTSCFHFTLTCCMLFTQSSTLPRYIPKQSNSLFFDLLHTVTHINTMSYWLHRVSHIVTDCFHFLHLPNESSKTRVDISQNFSSILQHSKKVKIIIKKSRNCVWNILLLFPAAQKEPILD